MSNSDQILESAQARARQMGLPYSGALLPQEAFQLWKSLPGAQLVDVRTRAEWDWVGRIPGAIEIERLLVQIDVAKLVVGGAHHDVVVGFHRRRRLSEH